MSPPVEKRSDSLTLGLADVARLPDAAASLPAAAARLPAAAARVPVAALGRVRSEAQSMWDEAHALARGDRAATGRSPRGSLPLRGAQTSPADQVYLAWYIGLATMATLRVIEWRLAAVVAGVHTIERTVHNPRLDEFAEGVGSGL